jgi:hypothetical protein
MDVGQKCKLPLLFSAINLLILYQALSQKHPAALWIIISLRKQKVDPRQSIEYLLCPIRRVFALHGRSPDADSLGLALRKLRILEWHVRRKPDWDALSSYFTLLEQISSWDAKAVAASITLTDFALFEGFTRQDSLTAEIIRRTTREVRRADLWVQDLAADDCKLNDHLFMIVKVCTLPLLISMLTFYRV